MWKRDSTASAIKRDSSPTHAAHVESTSTKKAVMDLGKSIVIKGELSGSEDVTLYGHMEGSIRLPDHTLTIGSDAAIKANISARIVVIVGAVAGNVTATEKVEIQATGSVTGDISSARLAVAEGGQLHGKVETSKR